MNPDNHTDPYAEKLNLSDFNNQASSEVTDPKQELKAAIRGSNEVLVRAKTVFPLVLFPDTLIVDREKITITKRTFFKTAEVMSIRIEDVMNATATIGPMFGSVKITSRILNNEKPYTVTNFWRDDALRLKKIIQGYIIAIEKKIDCSTLKTPELSRLLERLGADDHPSPTD